MSEFSRLSPALVDHPLLEPPDLSVLRARSRRRQRRRLAGFSMTAAVVRGAFGLTTLPCRRRSERFATRSVLVLTAQCDGDLIHGDGCLFQGVAMPLNGKYTTNLHIMRVAQ